MFSSHTFGPKVEKDVVVHIIGLQPCTICPRIGKTSGMFWYLVPISSDFDTPFHDIRPATRAFCADAYSGEIRTFPKVTAKREL